MGDKSEVLEAVLKEAVDLENIPIEEVFENLRCSSQGLSSEGAQERLNIFGHNKLEEKKERKFLKFLGFMWNPLSWVIEAAAIMAIPLANGGEMKSVGAEVNWGVRFNDIADCEHFLLNLCKEVSFRLNECGVEDRTITLKAFWVTPTKPFRQVFGFCASTSSRTSYPDVFKMQAKMQEEIDGLKDMIASLISQQNHNSNNPVHGTSQRIPSTSSHAYTSGRNINGNQSNAEPQQ